MKLSQKKYLIDSQRKVFERMILSFMKSISAAHAKEQGFKRKSIGITNALTTVKRGRKP